MRYSVELDEEDKYIQTFGGESYIDEFEFKDYGIQMGAVTVAGLTPEQYMQLGLSIINHLMANGHDFKISNDRNGNGDYIIGVLNKFK